MSSREAFCPLFASANAFSHCFNEARSDSMVTGFVTFGGFDSAKVEDMTDIF